MQASGPPITPGDIEQLKNSTKHDWIKGRVVAGKYQIVHVIAAGGMGIVLKAIHLQLQSPVAVKFSFDSKSSSAAQRFLHEAQVLTKLRHPGVAQVLDAGTDAGAQFLAMELIEGESLLAAVKDSFKLTGEGPEIETLFPWLRDIADALDYCHRQGVIHRDLKPANVILRSSDGQPVLVDFGLARWDDKEKPSAHHLTQTGEILGTPHYMAPEQVENHSDFGDMGPATDVWALGAILFYCLSGQTPYPEGPALQFYRHLMMNDPRTLVEVNPRVTSEISDFCSQCLTRDSRQRPSITECRDFFDAFLQSDEQSHRGLLLASIILAILVPFSIALVFLMPSTPTENIPLPKYQALESPTKKQSTVLSGTVHESIVSLEINTVSCPISHGEFSHSFDLTEGVNSFKARVKNDKGQTHNQSIDVTCDLSDPVISLDSESQDAVIFLEAGDDLTGQVTDLTAVRLFVNERDLELDSAHRFRWPWPNTGKIQFIELRAEDAVGHSAKLVKTVTTRALFHAFNKAFEDATILARQSDPGAKTKALTVLNDLIESCPKSALLPKVYRLRYQIYNDLKNNDKALESLDQGIDLCKMYFQDKDDSKKIYSELHSLRASCRLWRFRQYKPALDDYTRGLQLDPSRTGDHPNRAHCYRRLRQPEKALEILNLSIKNEYNHWSAYIYRAEIYKEQKRYKAALRDYESALKLNSKDPHSHYKNNAPGLKEKIANGEGKD